MITKNELEGWIKEQIWITYAVDVRLQKRLQISVGLLGFRVLHGQEILYDGPHMANAIRTYNEISTVPNLQDVPKLDN